MTRDQFFPYALPILPPTGDHPFLQALPLHRAHAQREYDALNAFVQEKRDLQSLSLSALFERSRSLHPSVRTRIRTLCGSAISHALFFASIGDTEQAPSGLLADAICAQYGSLDTLVRAAQGVIPDYPESGWLWLACHRRFGVLRLLFYRDADLPEYMTYEPLLCFDLWEHAYVRHYPDDPHRYLSDCFRFAAWERAGACASLLRAGRGA